MKKLLLTGATLAAATTLVAGEFTVKASCDKPKCVYALGEEATFTLEVTTAPGVRATAGELTLVMDDFGTTQFASNVVDLAQENPIVVKGTLQKPGFLRVRLFGDIGNKTSFAPSFGWSAAFAPERIVQKRACPDDFDAFWQGAIAKLEKEVPLDPQVVKDEARSASDRDFDWYRASFATFGGRVHGWLSKPKYASADRKVRALVQVPGAGFGYWSQNGERVARTATLFLTVFPFAPDTDLAKNRPLFDGMVKEAKEKWQADGYPQSGITGSREDGWYYRYIVGINRAVDWFARQDYVDTRSFTYSGTSQGGGFGLILMALNRHFTRGLVYVPALTGHYASEDGHQNGWPNFTGTAAEAGRAAAVANAAYYDGVYFARRVTCPVRFVVGFADQICAPHAVYAAYNACPSKDKEIRHGLGMGHGVFGEFYWGLSGWREWLPAPAAAQPKDLTKKLAWWRPVHEAHLKDVKAGGAPVVFLGDSITSGWHDTRELVWNQYFRDGEYRGINLGIGGDTTSGLLWRLQKGGELDGYTAKYVVVQIGTNNLGDGSDSVDDVVDGIRQVVNWVIHKQPKAKVVLMPILPRGERLDDPVRRRAEAVNAELAKAYATSHRVTLLDIYNKFLAPDGRLRKELYANWRKGTCDWLHPNDRGYKLWAGELVKLFKRMERLGPGAAQSELKDLRGTLGAMQGYRDQVRKFPNRHVNFLLVGDSITDHLHSGERLEILKGMMGTRTFYNIGVSGDETSHTLWRLETGGLDELTVDGIMLMIGTNNIGNQNKDSAEETAAGVRKVLDVLREKFPNARILQLATFPRGVYSNDCQRLEVQRLNALVKDYAKDDPRVTYMDLWDRFLPPDGRMSPEIMADYLHPTPKGDRIWFETVKPWFDSVPLTDGTGLKSARDRSFNGEKPWRDAVKPRIGNGWGEKQGEKSVANWRQRHEGFVKEAQERRPDVVFLGDSITDMFQNAGGFDVWNRYFATNSVNMGISGDRTENVLWRVQNGAVDAQPKAVVLMIGVNNIASPGETTLDTFLGVKSILGEIAHRSPKTTTLLMPVMPWGYEPDGPYRRMTRRLNETLRALADGRKVVFVDCHDDWLDADGYMTKEMVIDSLHPAPLGYERWSAAIRPVLSLLLK